MVPPTRTYYLSVKYLFWPILKKSELNTLPLDSKHFDRQDKFESHFLAHIEKVESQKEAGT